MKNFSRVVVVASVLLVGGVAARSAEAQLAYTAAVRDVPCLPGEAPPCSHGVIETVDTATGATIRSYEVWRNKHGFIQVAVYPPGDRLYVMTSPLADTVPQETSFQVVKIDTEPWSEEAQFTIPGAGGVLAFAPGGARLFVTRSELSDVAVIDTSSHTVVDSIPANRPYTVLAARDGRVYVSHLDNRITVHDGSSYGLLQTITLDSPVYRMTMSTGGSHLYGAAGGGTVVDVEIGTGAVSVITDVGAAFAQDVAYARGKLYVVAAAGVPIGTNEFITVIDPVTYLIIKKISLADPVTIVASPDESRVFATTFERWLAIDTLTDAVGANVEVVVSGVAFAAPTPYKKIFIDTPPAGATLRQPFAMSGWAVNVRGLSLEPGIETIHVWAHPLDGSAPLFVGVPSYGAPRPDIARLFGPRYLNTGFTLTVTGLPAGDYDLVAYGRCIWLHEFSMAAVRRVRVLPPQVYLFVDTPASGSTVFPSTPIAGWALDPASTSGSGIDAIHVWAYPATGGAPRFAGAATLLVQRPDVAAAFGPQFLHAGWILPGETSNLPPGRYTLVVYARHAAAGAFLAERQLTVTVREPVPMMAVDGPAAGSTVSSPVRIAGWAIDYGVTTGSGVDAIHVWATPAGGGAAVFLGAALYGGYRPDVAAAFGERFGHSAFELNATLPAGTYTLLVFPHVIRLGTFGAARTVTITVQ